MSPGPDFPSSGYRYAQAGPGGPPPAAGQRLDPMGFDSYKLEPGQFDELADRRGPGITDLERRHYAYPVRPTDPNVISGSTNNGGFYTNGPAVVDVGGAQVLYTPNPGETLVIYPATSIFGVPTLRTTIYRGS